MNEHDYVIFEIDDTSFAIPSALVDKVERAVLLTPVPDAPDPVLGVVSDGGDIVPVLGMRSRLGRDEREVRLSDRLIFSRVGARRVAVLADSVSAVQEILPGSLKEAEDIWPGVVYLRSMAGMEGDVIMMQDMDRVLGPDQQIELGRILEKMRGSEGPVNG